MIESLNKSNILQKIEDCRKVLDEQDIETIGRIFYHEGEFYKTTKDGAVKVDFK
jgi:hypothetical protein